MGKKQGGCKKAAKRLSNINQKRCVFCPVVLIGRSAQGFFVKNGDYVSCCEL